MRGRIENKTTLPPSITLLYSGKKTWTKMAFTNPFAWWARRTIIAWSALERKDSTFKESHLFKRNSLQPIYTVCWQLPLDLVYQWDLWDLLSLLDPVNLTQIDLMVNTGYYNLKKSNSSQYSGDDLHREASKLQIKRTYCWSSLSSGAWFAMQSLERKVHRNLSRHSVR